MNEEQNQSVRYSEIVDDLNNESFETSSTKFLMTSQNEMNSCKCKRMLFGSGIFVISILSVCFKIGEVSLKFYPIYKYRLCNSNIKNVMTE